jgi:hypothetical protein
MARISQAKPGLVEGVDDPEVNFVNPHGVSAWGSVEDMGLDILRPEQGSPGNVSLSIQDAFDLVHQAIGLFPQETNGLIQGVILFLDE